jgi:hypothetical protein
MGREGERERERERGRGREVLYFILILSTLLL